MIDEAPSAPTATAPLNAALKPTPGVSILRSIANPLPSSNAVDKRGRQIGAAWDLFKGGHYAEAAQRFERLYRDQPDDSSAEGLSYSLRKAGQEEKLAILSKTLGGPLQKRWNVQERNFLFEEKQFAAAAAIDPGGDPRLQHIDSPSFAMTGSFSEKSGDPGTSRFRQIVAPEAEGVIYADAIDRISVDIARRSLASDGLAPDAAIGHFPQGGADPAAPYAFHPITKLDDLTDFHFRYERSDAAWAPYTELGSTPLGADVPVSAVPVGCLGVLHPASDGNGYWATEVYGQSVEESLLSYTGIRDPYLGGTWGRVVDVGTAARGYVGLGDNWGFYGQGKQGWDAGEGVKSNYHLGIDLGVARDLKIEGFNYFTIGPAFSAEHFEHNLSHFTEGQGGYFSPDYLIEGMLGLNFLSQEGRTFLFEGNLGSGVQENHQAASPYFPLHPDGQSYGGDENTSFVFSSRIKALVLIASHWGMGAFCSYAKSADYNDFQGGLELCYFFESRTAVFSTDLPH